MQALSTSRPVAGLASRPVGRRAGRAAATAAAAPTTDLDVTAMAPLGDRLLIRPRPKETQTAGGVLLTSGATEQLQDAVVGTIIAKGADVEADVEAGDTVLFLKYSSADVEAPDGDICFVAEKSVLAKLS